MTFSPGTFSAPGENFSVVGKVAADLSRELTTKWHENLQPILQEQNDAEAAFLKMSTAHPDGVPEWTNNPRVTLMGDAVHCKEGLPKIRTNLLTLLRRHDTRRRRRSKYRPSRRRFHRPAPECKPWI